MLFVITEKVWLINYEPGTYMSRSCDISCGSRSFHRDLAHQLHPKVQWLCICFLLSMIVDLNSLSTLPGHLIWSASGFHLFPNIKKNTFGLRWWFRISSGRFWVVFGQPRKWLLWNREENHSSIIAKSVSSWEKISTGKAPNLSVNPCKVYSQICCVFGENSVTASAGPMEVRLSKVPLGGRRGQQRAMQRQRWENRAELCRSNAVLFVVKASCTLCNVYRCVVFPPILGKKSKWCVVNRTTMSLQYERI